MNINVIAYTSSMTKQSYKLIIEDKTYSGKELKEIVIQLLDLQDIDSCHLLSKDKIIISKENCDKRRNIYEGDTFYIIPRLISGGSK